MRKKTLIGIFSPVFPIGNNPLQQSGPSKVISSLSKGFAENGITVLVITKSLENKTRLIKKGDIHIYAIGSYYFFSFLSHLILGFIISLIYHRKYVIKFTYCTGVSSVLSYALKRIFNIPYVYKIDNYSGFWEHGSTRLSRFIYVKIHIYKFSNLIHCLNENHIFELGQLNIPDHRIMRINNCIHLNPVSIFSSREPDCLTFFYIGRLSREKNLENLIEVFCILSYEYDNIRLLVVGEGKNEKYFRKKVRTANCTIGKVLFLGYKVEPFRYVPSHSVFVLPSLREGQSMALLESLERSHPVIVSDIVGNRFIKSNETGLKFDPKSKSDLMEKMRFFINNPEEISRIGQNGRIYVKNYHSQKKICRMVLKEIWHKILNPAKHNAGRN